MLSWTSFLHFPQGHAISEKTATNEQYSAEKRLSKTAVNIYGYSLNSSVIYILLEYSKEAFSYCLRQHWHHEFQTTDK